MHKSIIHVLELMIGAVLLALGLTYLTSQLKMMDGLINLTCMDILENTNILQQYNDCNINLVSDEELYAMIMGYREYPIIIDGNLIEETGTEYELYSAYIQEGYYTKSYQYDSKHDIKQILFVHTGM